MSDEDDPAPLTRARREKRHRGVGDIDGGAIAVGLVLGLTTFAPTVLVNLPAWLVAGLFVAGVFLGGFLTVSVSTEEASCAGCHGGLMALGLVLVVAVVSVATVAAGEPVTDVAIVALVWHDWRLMLAGVILAVGLGALGGGTAARDGPREEGRNR